MPPPLTDSSRLAAQGVLAKPIAGAPNHQGVQARDTNQSGRGGAPPVYRPQNPPAHTKPGSGTANSIPPAAPPVYHPADVAVAAPAVYRPNVASPLQQKPGAKAPPVYRPAKGAVAAPAVYRPNVASLLQPKQGSVAPPVYRPQPAAHQHRTFGATAASDPLPNAQSRGANPYINQQAAHLQRMAQAKMTRRRVVHHQAVQPRNASPQGPVAQCHGNGETFRLPAAHTSRQPAPTANVVQKAEGWNWFKEGAKAVTQGVAKFTTAIIYDKPNPFAMETFTSCICFVFNVAGKTEEEFTSSWLYKHIFDSIKTNWTSRKAKGPFYALCPYDENHQLTHECLQLFTKTDIGDRPLIVVVGHCSPGSGVIQNDEHNESYTVSEVIQAISPAVRNRCTIYLTPCNTGVPNPSTGSKSFQDQFTQELNPGLEYFTIGTTSTTVPLFGKVWTADQTYTSKGQHIPEEEYLKEQRKIFVTRKIGG